MKSYQIALASSLLLIGLQGCFWDDAKAKVEEAKKSINSEIASAKRTADGLISDPALRDSAMNLLKSVMPEGVTVSSALEIADSLSSSGKLQQLTAALTATGAGTELKDLAQCLKAIPKQRNIPNPDCYGPTLEIKADLHPDYKPGDNMNFPQLPSGDLGIWTPTWQNPNGKTIACAAAKTNQLIGNASYYPDLAVGSMAMMVCVAAFHGDTLPGNGSKIDMTDKIKKLTDAAKLSTPWKGSFQKATIANENGSYRIELEGVLSDDTLKINALHSASTQAGNITIQSKRPKGEGNIGPAASPLHSVQVKYSQSGDTKNIQFASTGYGQGPNISESVNRWKNSLSSGNLNIDSMSFDADLNLMTAAISPTKAKIAYGWKAGAGDSHLRVFNAEVNGNTGTAWFGFSPQTNQGIDKIADLLSIKGMICNWAGPGNKHDPLPLVQRQELSKANNTWEASRSNIKYAPTNSCTVDNAGVFPTLGALPSHELLKLEGSNYSFSVPVLP